MEESFGEPDAAYNAVYFMQKAPVPPPPQSPQSSPFLNIAFDACIIGKSYLQTVAYTLSFPLVILTVEIMLNNVKLSM